MKKLIGLLLMLFISTTVPAAQPVASLVPIIGAGTFSCGLFMQYKAEHNPHQMDMIQQWVWGFMVAPHALFPGLDGLGRSLSDLASLKAAMGV